jgi:methylated-DNA-[protein]-cysteine S-methyltransferase
MNDQTKTFEARCYELLKLIPKGKVTTYGEIARGLNTKAYQAVGNAMAKNKNLFVIPCHRVIRSNGEIGNYALGAEKKAYLLKEEGVALKGDKVQNLEAVIYRFKR